MLLGMIGLALVWLSQVPFRLAEVWWDRRYDQTDSGYVETLFANWFALGAEFLFICFALVIVMALAGRFPRRWWIGAAPVFVGLATLFAFIYPYLSRHRAARPARPRGRRARTTRSSRGSSRFASRVEDVSDFTNAPNAYAVGFGPTQADRLLEHPARRPLQRRRGAASCSPTSSATTRATTSPRASRWYALFALPGAWLIAVATRRRGGMANPAAVPLSLLVLVVLDLALAAGLQRDLAAHGAGGGLGGARDDPRPRLGAPGSSATSRSSR